MLSKTPNRTGRKSTVKRRSRIKEVEQASSNSGEFKDAYTVRSVLKEATEHNREVRVRIRNGKNKGEVIGQLQADPEAAVGFSIRDSHGRLCKLGLQDQILVKTIEVDSRTGEEITEDRATRAAIKGVLKESVEAETDPDELKVAKFLIAAERVADKDRIEIVADLCTDTEKFSARETAAIDVTSPHSQALGVVNSIDDPYFRVIIKALIYEYQGLREEVLFELPTRQQVAVDNERRRAQIRRAGIALEEASENTLCIHEHNGIFAIAKKGRNTKVSADNREAQRHKTKLMQTEVKKPLEALKGEARAAEPEVKSIDAREEDIAIGRTLLRIQQLDRQERSKYMQRMTRINRAQLTDVLAILERTDRELHTLIQAIFNLDDPTHEIKRFAKSQSTTVNLQNPDVLLAYINCVLRNYKPSRMTRERGITQQADGPRIKLLRIPELAEDKSNKHKFFANADFEFTNDTTVLKAEHDEAAAKLIEEFDDTDLELIVSALLYNYSGLSTDDLKLLPLKVKPDKHFSDHVLRYNSTLAKYGFRIVSKNGIYVLSTLNDGATKLNGSSTDASKYSDRFVRQLGVSRRDAISLAVYGTTEPTDEQRRRARTVTSESRRPSGVLRRRITRQAISGPAQSGATPKRIRLERTETGFVNLDRILNLIEVGVRVRVLKAGERQAVNGTVVQGTSSTGLMLRTLSGTLIPLDLEDGVKMKSSPRI